MNFRKEEDMCIRCCCEESDGEVLLKEQIYILGIYGSGKGYSIIWEWDMVDKRDLRKKVDPFKLSCQINKRSYCEAQSEDWGH